MPDVRSKIVLSAEGGDKAAREIRKMQSALDDVSKSAQKTTQGVSLGGVSADPFTRAVQSAGDETYRRTLRTAQEKEEMDRRGLAHQQLTTGQQQLGRAAQTVSGYGAAGVQAISGGRMAGGAGAALGGTGALMGMSGVGALTGVGIGLLAAAGIAKGVDMLSQKEEERVRMLYPLARKSDMTYDALRDTMIRAGRDPNAFALPTEFAQFATSFVRAGGGAMTNAEIDSLARMRRTGMEFGVGGQFLGIMRRQGYQGQISEQMLRYGASIYGQGRLDEFFTSLGSVITEAQSKGVEKGWEDVSVNMLRYRQAGFTPDTATQVYQTVESVLRGATAMSRPEDAVIFRALREEGMSYNEVMKIMARGQLGDPTANPSQKVYAYLKKLAGGDEGKFERMIVETFKITWGQLDEFMTALETRTPLPSDKAIAPIPKNSMQILFRKLLLISRILCLSF